MVAIPTTAGTGSETTGTAIFDLLEMHIKTGIAHRALRPQLGIIDPDNTRTMPKMVAACSGLDVLCHALELLTALPYQQRVAPETPAQRPAYQGANPISDIRASNAIEILAQNSWCVRSLIFQMTKRGTDASSFFFCRGLALANRRVTFWMGMSYLISGMGYVMISARLSTI